MSVQVCWKFAGTACVKARQSALARNCRSASHTAGPRVGACALRAVALYVPLKSDLRFQGGKSQSAPSLFSWSLAVSRQTRCTQCVFYF